MDSTRIADIMLGTYDHDRFKPFWLGQAQHALLGYTYSRAVRQQREAYCLAILLHAPGRRFPFPNLVAWHTQTWPNGERHLPKALIAANWIDRIASSSHSVFGELDSGQSLFSKFEVWRPSVQNPFSRLPIYDRHILHARVCHPDLDASQFAADLFRSALLDADRAQQWAQLEIDLRAALRADPEIDKEARATRYHLLAAALQQMSSHEVETLDSAYGVFAERTYPHPNDTSLRLHTKLAANLYHLLLANLSAESPLAGAGLEAMPSAEIEAWFGGSKERQMQNLRHILNLLQGSVVTIRLAGIEERYRSAVRLDDLQGAKLLADRVRYALKARLRDSLGFADVAAATAVDGTTIADLLCLSESRFTLTYLLPRRFVVSDSALMHRLYALYDESLVDVVTQPSSVPPDSKSAMPLLDYLTLDIQRTLEDAGAPVLPDLRPAASEILDGLRAMPPAFGIAAVTLDVEMAHREEEYGYALVDAYAASQRSATSGTMADDVWALVATMSETVDDGTTPICSSSHSTPAWTALSAHAYGRAEPAVPLLQQYFHTFRSEQEELSQASTAIRALAHGHSQVDALDHLIHGEPDPLTGAVRLHFTAPEPGQPPAPPLLHQRDHLSRSDGLVDLNVAYVRMRRDAENQSDPLIRFPSLSYAADKNGNVAMLTLRPTDALYEEHRLQSDFVSLVGGHEESFAGLQAKADFCHYYLNTGRYQVTDPATRSQLTAELLHVRAHLARVLQRQQTLSAFLTQLPKRLEAAGVRVLPLEHEHPVGRYLIPAEALPTALHVLDRSIHLDLLSVNGADLGLDDATVMSGERSSILAGAPTEGDQQKRARLRRFLTAYIQDLLVGSAIIFKHKQALYLMLRAEERLQARIERKPILTMALADMRGTLVDRAPLHGQYSFADWDKLHALLGSVDRRSLAGLAQDWHWYESFAGTAPQDSGERERQLAALSHLIQARWQNRIDAADVRKLATPDWDRLAQPGERSLLNTAFVLMRAARN